MHNCIEIEPATAATHAIIWLHGLGADGHDFIQIARELNLPPEMAVRFVFPHAPRRPIGINSGAIMRGWYDIPQPDLQQHEDEIGLNDSAKLVGEFIAGQQNMNIAAENIVVGGFSQGGALALHAGLSFPNRLGGIISLSAYLPLVDKFTDNKSTANQHTPLFIAHGSCDPIVPIELGRRTRHKLIEHGYDVTWFEYPIAHAVAAQEIIDLRNFLCKVINTSQT